MVRVLGIPVGKRNEWRLDVGLGLLIMNGRSRSRERTGRGWFREREI